MRGVYNGSGSFILNHICCFLLMRGFHVDVSTEGIIYKGIRLRDIKCGVSGISSITIRANSWEAKRKALGEGSMADMGYGVFLKQKN